MLSQDLNLKNHILEKYQGLPISFDQAFNEVMGIMPQTLREKYSKAIKGIKVEDLALFLDEADLNFTNRFITPFNVKRAKKATISWSLEPIKSLDQAENAIDRVIHIATMAEFVPIRKWSILTTTKSRFIRQNAEVVADKVFMKLLTADDSIELPSGSIGREIYRTAKNVAKDTLPLHYFHLNDIKLNKYHKQILETQGPHALYRHLLTTESEGLALKYYFTHLSNVKSALVVALVSILTPKVLESYAFLDEHESINFEDPEDYKNAQKIIKNMNMTPEELLDDIESKLDKINAPKEEKELFESMLKDLDTEVTKILEQEKKTKEEAKNN